MEVTGREIINSDKLKCPYLRIVAVRRERGGEGYNIKK